MKKANRIVIAAGTAVVVLLAANAAYVRSLDPIGQVRAKAVELGYADEELTLVEGGYSSRILGWEAHATFLVADSERRVDVRMTKSAPLVPWRLDSHRIQAPR